jgi:carboxylesterase type B
MWLNTYPSWDNPTLGSAHGDELVAFFTGTQVLDPLDEALAVVMREYWTSFVTSGTPVAVDSIAWPVSVRLVCLIPS